MQDIHEHRKESRERAHLRKKSREYKGTTDQSASRSPNQFSSYRHQDDLHSDSYHDPNRDEGYVDFRGSERPSSSSRHTNRDIENEYVNERAERRRSKRRNPRHENAPNISSTGHKHIVDQFQDSDHSYVNDSGNHYGNRSTSRVSHNRDLYRQDNESDLSDSIQYAGSVPASPLPSTIPTSNGRHSQEPPESFIGSNSNLHSESYSGYEQDVSGGRHSNAFVGSGQGYWNPEFGQSQPQNIPQQDFSEVTPAKKVLAKFFASFRRRKPKSLGGSQIIKPSDNTVSARVIMLDGEELVFQLNRDDVGQVLFDHVCQSLDLYETDYFGLTFVSNKIRTWFWLDLQTKIGKQLRDNEQWFFYFQVKFYPPEPSMLQEDLTRYQLTLQIRQDIYTGKLPCSWVTQALLGSFMVQAELGDYDAEKHVGLDYLNEFEFVPSPTPQLLKKIAELHKTHNGMKPNQADIKYLETAKRLELYGVDLHPARDTENVEIYIGVGFHGVVIYRDRLRIGRFAWPKVLRISYKKNNFYLKIRPDYSEPVEAIVGFRLLNPHLANRLWKAAVEHHAFFRLKETPAPKRPLPTPSLSKSHFRYTGRTFFQYRTMNIDRPHPRFNRSMLKRRTASMPTGLNASSVSMHTLNRSHPRDMTIGRSQNDDQSGGLKRFGSVQMGQTRGMNGDGTPQLYSTVPRNHPYSGSIVSEAQDANSQMSRQYSEGIANSLSYGSVSGSYRSDVLPDNEYVNYRQSRRTKPNEVLSVTSGSQQSDYSTQRDQNAERRGKHPSEISSSTTNGHRANSPIYANTKAHHRNNKKHHHRHHNDDGGDEDDEAGASTPTNTMQYGNAHSADHNTRASVQSSGRRPPVGGVPVFGGVMVPNHHHQEKARPSDRLRSSSNSNRTKQKYPSEEKEEEEQTVTLTEDEPNDLNQYRSSSKHRKQLATNDYDGAASNYSKAKHSGRSHRRQSGNVEGML
ncbi:unnamed protein product [Trichobilharzia szidati]|nr:unnamed protein product [Trichobilharzia szidati]